MAKFLLKLLAFQLIFGALVLTPVAFGQEKDDYEYPEQEQEEDEDPNPQTTTVAPQRQKERTTLSPEEANESRLVDRIMAKLNVAESERNAALNRTLEQMQRQITRFRNLVQSPASCGSNNNNGRIQPGSNVQIQTHAELIQKLENEIKSLKNQTLNRQLPVLNEVPIGAGANPDPDDNDDKLVPALVQEELHSLGDRIEAVNSSLSNIILDNIDRFSRDLDNITRDVQAFLKIDKEKKRCQTVEDLLKAYASDAGGLDRVRSYLNDLSQMSALDSSMPEIVERMFNGNILNYPKILAFFKSARKSQYKSGLVTLIDYFQSIRSSSTSSKCGAATGSGGASNPARASLVDDPNFLRLAYVAKLDFANELQSKFPQLFQNLVFKDKVSFRNLQTNLCLFVDRADGLKPNGYSVSTRKKTSVVPATGCDWEIVPLREGESFVIRQISQNQNQNQAETLNLNVQERAISAATVQYNPVYLWKIQIRKNAQEVTLQNVPGSSNVTPYFLCSVPTGKRTVRAVQLIENGEGKSCPWFIDS